MNSKEIREVLSATIKNLIEKKIGAADANAVSNATGKIMSNIRLEMEYAKLTGGRPLLDGYITLEDKASTPQLVNAKSPTSKK